MNNHMFVLLEDPITSSHADVLKIIQNTTSQGTGAHTSFQMIHLLYYYTIFIIFHFSDALKQLPS